MRRIRLSVLAGFLTMGAVAFVARPDAAPKAEAVDVAVLRYPDLVDKIKAQRGQVVVVDFWTDYCLPCKREFPKLVELHRKYSRGGLACVSVSLDDANDNDAKARVHKFLRERQATFANVMLAATPQEWQAKLKIDGPPCVFVFNRRGELLKKYHDDVDYKDIEKLVVEALKD